MKEPKDKKCQLTLDHRSKESIQQVTITKSTLAKKETVDRNKISIFTDNWDIFTEQVIDSSYSNVTICGIYYTTILHTICGIYYTQSVVYITQQRSVVYITQQPVCSNFFLTKETKFDLLPECHWKSSINSIEIVSSENKTSQGVLSCSCQMGHIFCWRFSVIAIKYENGFLIPCTNKVRTMFCNFIFSFILLPDDH